MAEDATPATPSADHSAMMPFWLMIDAILGGAATMRASGTTLLPKFTNESDELYGLRRLHAPFTNLYADISRNLASKPFSKPIALNDDGEVQIVGELDERTKARSGGLADDIDGQGNSLHVFASEYFKGGLDRGLSWCFVDHPAAPAEGRVRTLAEEREAGLRPYWVHIPGPFVLAAYSEQINGAETLVHVRVLEPQRKRQGFGEVEVRRVRVIDREVQRSEDGSAISAGPPLWTLYEERDVTGGAREKEWVTVGGGEYSIGVIPMVPFIPGKRHGSSFVVDPPLRDLAHMQIEEFQQESNLKEVKNLTAFPMLVGRGVAGVDDKGDKIKVPVGPRAVLFAPAGVDGQIGDWKFIEPGADSLRFLKDDLAALRQEMRDLGMQPLLAANLTVITTANVSQKASSAVQAWTILFKDALDRCLSLTSKWLGVEDRTVAVVHTDFVVEADGDKDVDTLLKARMAGEISRETWWAEMQRRGKLGPDFDPAQEADRIEGEGPDGGVTDDDDAE
jgi:hypothetical protein